MGDAFDFVRPSRTFAMELVSGRGHYDRVIAAIRDARQSVWIATANVKDLLVEDDRAAPGVRRTAAGTRRYRSMLAVFDEAVARGVDIRLLHAAPPSRPFRAQLASLPRLGGGAAGRSPTPKASSFALRQCPRVHLKLVVVDGAFVYLGSANFTGAGLGVKGEGRRNFELGVVSADDQLLDEVQALYDEIWQGRACRRCRLRASCPAPLDGLGHTAPQTIRDSRRRAVKSKVGGLGQGRERT